MAGTYTYTTKFLQAKKCSHLFFYVSEHNLKKFTVQQSADITFKYSVTNRLVKLTVF